MNWLQIGLSGRLLYDKKKDGGTVYKQIFIDIILKTGKTGQKTELTGRSPFRRRRSTLDCSAS